VRQLIFISYLLSALAFTATTQAEEAKPAAADPVLEQHVLKLTEELRCLVCQNQTIADSHSDLAIDLKNQVREQLHQGKSDQDVLDYMVERYGDFVLYRPPVKISTWLLWFGPFALLIGAIVWLVFKLKRRQTNQADDVPLTEEEHQRASALLSPQNAHKDHS
jgi:cytochrome c-type biogenesis protein CcmH